MRILLLSAVIVLSLALGDSRLHAAEEASVKNRLHAFAVRVAAIESGKVKVGVTEDVRRRAPRGISDGDAEVFKAFAEFEQTIKDDELATVDDFAESKEGERIRWLLVRLFIDRGKFDAAAKTAAFDLVAHPKDREYRLWKWWEVGFSDRKDYNDLTRSFTDALLRQFAAGNAETKLVVAEVFGKGEAESKLPLVEFKTAIHYDRAAKAGKH
jgi:hypothetical protein